MKVTVWNYDIYDWAAEDEEYNFFALHKGCSIDIVREPVLIGDWKFVPGHRYSRIGSNKYTSAGFTWYDGPALTFQGHWNGILLFTWGDKPFTDHEDYEAIYYAYRFHVEEKILVTLNRAGSGRVIRLDYDSNYKQKELQL